MTIDPEEFRKTLGCFASGVTIVTTETQDGTPYGLTVSAFTSVSLGPPLVLICIDNRSSGLESFRENGKFAVNILSEEQQDLSTHFATTGADRTQADYRTGKTGIPVLEAAMVSLECTITAEYPGGDHLILLGEVQNSHIAEPETNPLLYYQGRYRGLK